METSDDITLFVLLSLYILGVFVWGVDIQSFVLAKAGTIYPNDLPQQTITSRLRNKSRRKQVGKAQ